MTDDWTDPEPWVVEDPLPDGESYWYRNAEKHPRHRSTFAPRSKEQWLKDERRKAKHLYFAVIYGFNVPDEERQRAGRIINRSGEIGFAAAVQEARDAQQ